MKVIWLDQAREDYDHQIDYIVERSPFAAADQGDLIVGQIESLADFPEKGRIGRKRGTRELIISGTPFIAIYRVRPRLDRIEISFLIHHAELWPKRRKKT